MKNEPYATQESSVANGNKSRRQEWNKNKMESKKKTSGKMSCERINKPSNSIVFIARIFSFQVDVEDSILRIFVVRIARWRAMGPSGAKSTVINLFVFGASHKMNIIIARGSLPNFIHDQFN